MALMLASRRQGFYQETFIKSVFGSSSGFGTNSTLLSFGVAHQSAVARKCTKFELSLLVCQPYHRLSLTYFEPLYAQERYP